MVRLFLLSALLIPFVAAAPSDFGEWQSRAGAAFKPLRLPPARQVEAELEPRLPAGIVTEAAPFAALVDSLLAPLADTLDERATLLRSYAPFASAKSADTFATLFQTLAKEDEEYRKRIAGVEAAYGEVYAKGWNEAGEKDRNTRKAAAVLIPFYRTLLARNESAAEDAAQAMSALKVDAPSLAWLASVTTKKPARLRAAAAEALAGIGGPEALAALDRVVRGDDDPDVRLRALSAMTVLKVREISDLAIVALADADWRVVSLAGEICARGRVLAAAEPMIAALERSSGRLREDLDLYLGTLLGVRMQGDPELWRKWWAENGERVRSEAAAAGGDESLGRRENWDPLEGEGRAEEKRPGASAFYGIVTTSRRVAYVVDISLSMDSPAEAVPTVTGSDGNPHSAPAGRSKLDIAKWQLHRALHDLPEDALFDVIVYSESYKVWEPSLVTAAKRKKDAANAFVDALKANGTTNIGDSLDRALDLGADTIYLLSDGEPNRGRITDVDRLVEWVKARNLLARAVIHTVGIGEAAGSRVLMALAGATGGRYVGFK